MEIKHKESLKEWSWWKVGGLADHFCQPENLEDIQQALNWAEENKVSFSILGGGTNTLISDQGVEGLVISTHKLKQWDHREEDGHLKIWAFSGVDKSQIMQVFKKHKLAPALFLTGIPGDLGGGVVMNAGVNKKNFNPSEFSQIVHWFEVVTSKGVKRYHKEDIEWGYRFTSGWEKGVIFNIHMTWPMQPIEDLNQQVKSELKKRRASQPLEWPSCGSVFRNPYPHYAGDLIEKSGLKGLKQGEAMISDKHGNFIINKGGAKAQDIHYLIQKACNTVQEKFNILMKPEVHYLGRWKEKS